MASLLENCFPHNGCHTLGMKLHSKDAGRENWEGVGTYPISSAGEYS
jgi:hypothetical protein